MGPNASSDIQLYCLIMDSVLDKWREATLPNGMLSKKMKLIKGPTGAQQRPFFQPKHSLKAKTFCLR